MDTKRERHSVNKVISTKLAVACTVIGCFLSGPNLAETTGPAKTEQPVTALALGNSYIHGTLTGALASHLPKKVRPSHKWRGEKDGTVMLSGKTLSKLSEARKWALREALRQENPVIITKASQSHIDALHKLVGAPSAVNLALMPDKEGVLDAYGVALPSGQLRAIAVSAFPKGKKPEPNSSRDQRALGVASWVVNRVRRQRGQNNKFALAQDNGYLQLSASNPPWQLTTQDSMPAYWATCGMDIDGTYCVNQITQYIDAWMVYNADVAEGQPSDFFIMQTSATVNTAGCKDFYGTSRPHSTRIAAYWLRQFNTSAQVLNIGIGDMTINQGYAPQSANPNVTVERGTTWSFSGSGNFGFQGNTAAGGISFTGGVSFSNSNSQSYPALATQVNINSTSDTANVASWTYDSWNFVHSQIEPSDHACGGPGLDVNAALPSIIYGGTFEPSQNWVWQALPAVRQKFNGTKLPVTVNSSALLGWAFYSQQFSCLPTHTPPGGYDTYSLSDSWAGSPWVVGSGATAGINFDVSCNVTTNYGTIPLGPHGAFQQDNNAGNPGTPYSFPDWKVNIPFAPTTVPCPTLAKLTPASGPVGQVVTLEGTNLRGATTVNFGGISISSSTFSYTKDGTIQVTAPSGNTGIVDVSTANTSCTSNALNFTYGNQ